jgi:CheY-like chemotaxis protein
VDDDPDSRMLMADLLTSEGYRVTTAGNGREALNRCAPWHAGPLRSVPVIVCSGSDEANKLMTDELQARACLSKPVSDFDPLLKHVEAACQRSM